MKERQNTDRVIFHHSLSGDVSAETIRGWHIDKGWSDIGYHFVIRMNGDIEKGRSVELVGAHSRPDNRESIGVCLVGDFSKIGPTLAQYNSAVQLFNQLNRDYDGTLRVGYHRSGHNACPGPLFDARLFAVALELGEL